MRDRRNELIISILLAFFFLTLFIVWQMQPRLVDDAFITYRYSANLAAGHGLVYNPGQFILGTTSPGYALLLTPFAAVFGVHQIPTISHVINTISILIIAINVSVISYRVTEGSLIVAVIAGGLTITSYYTSLAGTSGMDASVFLMLCSTGVMALTYRRLPLAAGAFGLMPLIRPEGVFGVGFLILTFGILYWKKQLTHKSIFLLLLLLLTPELLYLVAATLTYGSPLPQSVQAKLAGLYPEGVGITIGRIVEYLTTYLFRYLRLFSIYPLSAIDILLSAMVSGTLMIFGGWWLFCRCAFLWIVPALLFTYLIFYALSGTLIFEWYFANFDILGLLCWSAGIYFLLTRLNVRRFKKISPQKFAAIIALSLALGQTYLHRPWLHYFTDFTPHPHGFLPDRDRQESYYQLANQLAPLLPPNTQIAMPEIGVLGFYMPDAYVLDTAGLVSPEAVAYFPIPENERAGPSIGSVPRGLIHDYLPELVITFEIFGRDGILDDPWFLENYILVIDWEYADSVIDFGSTGLFVYAYKDFQPGLALRSKDF